jgi:hypothetical protein
VQLPITIVANILSVVSVNEADRTMTSELYAVIKWSDDALAWNASQFGDIENITLPIVRPPGSEV